MADDLENKKHDLNRRVLEKILNDPVFREQISKDPESALQGSEFWQPYQEISQAEQEVSGYDAGSQYCCVTCVVFSVY